MRKVKFNKLLGVSKDIVNINIGDYVQALASSQFYPHIDGFIEREELDKYNGPKCKVIMNGWYMDNPKNWPPSSSIDPLFVAFHINSIVKDQMLSSESISYLKKFEPIGCRDTNTMNMLKDKDVNAYFSGCMTLTLGYKFASKNKDNKVYFVDPSFSNCWNLQNLLSSILYLLGNFNPIFTIARKYPGNESLLKKCLKLTTFYKEYSVFFSKEVLVNAEYICQQSSYYSHNFPNNDKLLGEAKRLVEKYAKARLVVTSRIHCALPCLGLETPVIFTELANQSEASLCRFGGLRDLFNVIVWKNGKLQSDFNIVNKITEVSDVPLNKELWKPLAQALIVRCKDFFKDGNA